MRPDRRPFASGDWFDGTEEEYREEALTYIAYSGPAAIFFGHGNPMNAISRNDYKEGCPATADGEGVTHPSPLAHHARRGMNFKGVFSRDRRPKTAAHFLRSRWAGKQS